MEKEKFIKCFKFLNVAYNKDFNDDQVMVWYKFFKDEDFNTFRKAIEDIITKNKYMPSIAELINEIKYVKAKEIVNYMNECGKKEEFQKKQSFNFECDEEATDMITTILKRGYTNEDIKKGIDKAYYEFVENKKDNSFNLNERTYTPWSLFDTTPGKNIIYFMNE